MPAPPGNKKQQNEDDTQKAEQGDKWAGGYCVGGVHSELSPAKYVHRCLYTARIVRHAGKTESHLYSR